MGGGCGHGGERVRRTVKVKVLSFTVSRDSDVQVMEPFGCLRIKSGSAEMVADFVNRNELEGLIKALQEVAGRLPEKKREAVGT